MGLTSQSYIPKEIRATGREEYFYSIPVSVVQGSGVAGIVDVGTVMGKVTASGKYKPYASGNSDGSQTPVGILTEMVDTNAADVNGIGLYVMGFFVEANLTGLDSGAKTALGTRSFSDGTIRL